MKQVGFFTTVFFIVFYSLPFSATAQAAWYMAGGNPQRTSWLTNPVQNIQGVSWYRPIEAYIDQKTQIITANGKIYVSTTKGLIVLDAETGELKWRFDTELPLGHSPTVQADVVYVAGFDRKVYAIRDLGSTYQLLWEFTGSLSGFSVNPLVVSNRVYLGGRDGNFYALDTQTGNLVWSFHTSGPILNSAAYDQSENAIYFASNDMYAYKLDAASGRLLWKSPQQLPGESYQSWWPVIYNNYIVFSSAPAFRSGTDPGSGSVVASADIKEMFRSTYFGSVSGNAGNIITLSDSSSGWPAGTRVLDTQANSSHTQTLDAYFRSRPEYRIYPILNKSDGREPFVLPYFYTGTASGNAYPPLVNSTENTLYMNNLYSGAGNTGGIGRASLMGFQPNNRYLKLIQNSNFAVDEPISYSAAGTDVFYSLCCDRAAGYLNRSTNWWSYPYILEGVLPVTGPEKYDQMWQKYGTALERLSSYYNGDPQNTGGQESRNGMYNSHGLQNPPIPYTFTNSLGQRVDRAFIHRSNAIISLGPIASKTYLPLIRINSQPTHQARTLDSNNLASLLETEIDKIIDVYEANPTNGFLNPGYYNDAAGIPGRIGLSAFYFQNPADGLLVLSESFPLIRTTTLRDRLRTYLRAYYDKYFSATPVTTIGWTNQPRHDFQTPSEVASSMSARPDSSAGAISQKSFYALWKYAVVFPDQAQSVYNRFRNRLVVPSQLTNTHLTETPHLFNEYISGFYGFLNLQSLAGMAATDATLRNSVQTELDSLVSRRISGFSKDHPWLGEVDNPSGIRINNYVRQFNMSRNFYGLSPYLGNLFRSQNQSLYTQSINEYQYLAPFWFTAFQDNAFQENVKNHLYDTVSLFSAKAWIGGATVSDLSKYLDVPSFSRGDLFYIQKLNTLLASGPIPTLGNPTLTPTPVVLPGDANNDTNIDGIDYVIWLNNYGQTRTGSTFGDFNHDNRVDGVDYVIWLNNYGI